MKWIAASALGMLVACSPSFSTGVATFSTPIANSLGQVCWVEVDTAAAPTIRTATFHADASYDPGALTLTDRVEIQIFGRAEAPTSACTGRDAANDVPLSDPFELERRETQPIEVGGAAFGTDLAALVNTGTFWLGAAAAGNVSIGDETVLFENGRITVGF